MAPQKVWIEADSRHRVSSRRLRQVFLLSVAIAGTMAAGAQAAMPDAQVESNVLKALASAPELANEAIVTQTVFGTVTLTGTVATEENRRRAETIVANTNGVKKVVDELSLTGQQASSSSGSANPPAAAVADGQSPPAMVLQSDGTYAPIGESSAQTTTQPPEQAAGSAPAAQAERNNPEADQDLDRQMENGRALPPGPAQPPSPPYRSDSTPGRRPMNAPYPPYGYPPSPNQQSGGYGTMPYPQDPRGEYGGQAAGQPVTIPSGTMIRVRLNRTLSSDRSQPGTIFDGTVVNDVVAGGFVAIPRGASVQGRVVEAQSSGVLKGRGELSIQLTQVTLGGRNYPIVSEVWAHHGGDKTIETVNKTAGFGAAGAVIGAIAGGGVGAAVGGGIGAAAGLGSSAASGNGQVVIPSEGMVTFHLQQQAEVQTVSEQEMQRLAYGVPPGADQRYARRRAYPVYPRVYVGPGYPYPYPGPYGYPPY